MPNRRLLASAALALVALRANADETLLAPEAFLAQAFGSAPPSKETIWIDTPLQARLRAILGHPFTQARVHYWRGAQDSAWILDETGKEFPITAGFVVRGQSIDHANLLVYRESRGGEIRFPSFLKQFAGQRLDNGGQLVPDVDGISGATLSVSAMRRMARAALVMAAAATERESSSGAPTTKTPD